jgi:predicted aconitase
VEELREIAQLLEGEKVHNDVLLLVGTTEPLRLLAQQMGLVNIIEKAGGLVVSGICAAGSFLRRNVPSGFTVGVAATNAAKAAHYLKASGVQCWFGTMQKCLNAAVKGRWEVD